MNDAARIDAKLAIRRSRRGTREKLSLSASFKFEAKGSREAGAAVTGAYEALTAAGLSASSIHLAGGTLTLGASDASARFVLDRWLRGGARIALLRLTGVRRVKVMRSPR